MGWGFGVCGFLLLFLSALVTGPILFHRVYNIDSMEKGFPLLVIFE